MGFPWESHSHGNSHFHAHLYREWLWQGAGNPFNWANRLQVLSANYPSRALAAVPRISFVGFACTSQRVALEANGWEFEPLDWLPVAKHSISSLSSSLRVYSLKRRTLLHLYIFNLCSHALALLLSQQCSKSLTLSHVLQLAAKSQGSPYRAFTCFSFAVMWLFVSCWSHVNYLRIVSYFIVGIIVGDCYTGTVDVLILLSMSFVLELEPREEVRRQRWATVSCKQYIMHVYWG